MNWRIWILAVALASAPTIAAMSSAGAPHTGTVESVMAVGKEASVAAQDRASMSRAIAAFTNRLATDRTFATQMLSAIQKQDTTGMATLMRQAGLPGRIEVGRIDPGFHFEINVTTSSSFYHLCFSDEHSCEGHNIVLG